LVKARLNNRKKLLKLTQAIELIFADNIAVSFEVSGLLMKILEKLHTAKQARKAAQALLIIDRGFLIIKKTIR